MKNLQLKRQMAGLTQKQLADKVGTTQGTISFLESNTSGIVSRLCDFFGRAPELANFPTIEESTLLEEVRYFTEALDRQRK
jgi:transcriptional regulator with XRE-family HTH domain